MYFITLKIVAKIIDKLQVGTVGKTWLLFNKEIVVQNNSILI